MATRVGTFTCPSTSSDFTQDVTIPKGRFRSLIVLGVNHDSDGWRADGSECCSSVGIATLNGLTAGVPGLINAVTSRTFRTGDLGGAVFNPIVGGQRLAFLTYDDIVGGTGVCSGYVEASIPGGFRWRWVNGISGRKVFYILVGAGSELGLEGGQPGVGASRTSGALFLVGRGPNHIDDGASYGPFGGFGFATDIGDGMFAEFRFNGSFITVLDRDWQSPDYAAAGHISLAWKPNLALGTMLGDDIIAATAYPYGYTVQNAINGQAIDTWAMAGQDQTRGLKVETTADHNWGDAFLPSAILTIGPSFGEGTTFNTSGSDADTLHGSGIGLWGIQGDLSELNACVGIGRDTSGEPFSWQLPDRSWVSDTDRDSAGASLTAGTITATPGTVAFTQDDAGGSDDTIMICALGDGKRIGALPGLGGIGI